MAWEWLTSLNGYNLSYATNHDPDWHVNGQSWSASEGSTFIKGNDPATVSGQANYTAWQGAWSPSGNDDLEFYTYFNGWSEYKLHVDHDLTQLFGFLTGSNNYTGGSIGIGINYDTEEASPIFFTNINRSTNWYVYNADLWSTVDHTKLHNFYLILMGIIPPEHEWHSVKSISGALGTFNFCALPDEMLTGEPITNLERSDFEQWSDQTSFYNLTRDLVSGAAPTAVMYSGDECYCDAEVVGAQLLQMRGFKFYVQTQQILAYNQIAPDEVNRWAFMIDFESQVAVAVLVQTYTDEGGFTKYAYRPFNMTDAQMSGMYIWLTASNPEDDPSINHDDEGGDVDPWNETPIEGLTIPSVSAIDTGFTSMFKISASQLKSLSNFLWSDDFLDNVKKFFSDPREIIVGLSIMPLSPDVGSLTEIKAGRISTGVQGLPLSSQYKKIDDFGSIYIKKSKGNFLDYPPYTKITAHLPYVGAHSLDVNDVMGHTLTLSYIFDFLSGSCVACISKDGNPRYFFGGSCSVQIPTSSEDFGRLYSSILSAGATVGATMATIATGGMALPATVAAKKAAKGALTAEAAIGAGANTAQSLMNMTPTVEYSSGGGSINGLLTSQTAFLVVETPNEKIASKQAGFTGRPSYTKVKLENASGYIKCLEVHLDKFGGTDTERNAVETALYSGLRIEEGSETPVYIPTTPLDQAVIFLKCESDRDVMGKTWKDENEGDVLTVEGKLLFDKNILSPSFLITGVNLFEYNYAYIPLFKRFYYIKEMTVKSGTVIEVSFEEDPLQSWKTDIEKNDVILERAEKNYNAFFNDAEYWTLQNKTVKVVPFKNSNNLECLFDRSDNSYILTIAGG